MERRAAIMPLARTSDRADRAARGAICTYRCISVNAYSLRFYLLQSRQSAARYSHTAHHSSSEVGECSGVRKISAAASIAAGACENQLRHRTARKYLCVVVGRNGQIDRLAAFAESVEDRR